MPMAFRNIAAALGLIVFSVWYAYLTSGLPDRSIMPNTPGPSFFPWVIAAIIFCLSLALLIKSMIELRHTGVRVGAIALPTRSLLMLGSFLVYVVVLPHAGFIIASAVFFAAQMLLYGSRSPALVAVASIAIPVTLFVIFRYAFQIILPHGLFAL